MSSANLHQPRIRCHQSPNEALSFLRQTSRIPVAAALVDSDVSFKLDELIDQLHASDPLMQIWLLGRATHSDITNREYDWIDKRALLADPNGLIRVITKLWRAQRHNQRANVRAQLAERVAQTGHWEWNPSNNQARWSTELARLLDIDSVRCVGNADLIWERIHPDDRLTVRAELQRCVCDRAHRSLNFRIQHGDGSVRTVRHESMITVGESDTGHWIASVLRDITEK